MSLTITSNDRVIHESMQGKHFRRDRDILQNQVYLRKMVVTLDTDYKPTFSIDRFHFPDRMPTPNNYKNAMEHFSFFCQDFIENIPFRVDIHTKFDNTKTTRNGLEEELKRLITKHGENHFYCLYTQALLDSDWPETHIPYYMQDLDTEGIS